MLTMLMVLLLLLVDVVGSFGNGVYEGDGVGDDIGDGLGNGVGLGGVPNDQQSEFHHSLQPEVRDQHLSALYRINAGLNLIEIKC